jgi:hypothetical protein
MKKFATFFAIALFLGLTAVTWAEKGAEKGKKKAATCPISKKAISKDVFVKVNGKKTFFCCKGCVTPYLTKVLKIEDAGPVKCPLSGKPAKAETGLIHKTVKSVSFCCNNCQKSYLKKNKLEVVDKGPSKCPVSGKPAKAAHSVNVNGEKVYFCCANCPKGYVKKLGVAKTKGAAKCPISGKPGKPETAVFHVSHKKVYFCCNNCQATYAKKNFAKKGPAKGKRKKKDA